MTLRLKWCLFVLAESRIESNYCFVCLMWRMQKHWKDRIWHTKQNHLVVQKKICFRGLHIPLSLPLKVRSVGNNISHMCSAAAESHWCCRDRIAARVPSTHHRHLSELSRQRKPAESVEYLFNCRFILGLQVNLNAQHSFQSFKWNPTHF